LSFKWAPIGEHAPACHPQSGSKRDNELKEKKSAKFCNYDASNNRKTPVRKFRKVCVVSVDKRTPLIA
jgi:hypothetical protein